MLISGSDTNNFIEKSLLQKAEDKQKYRNSKFLIFTWLNTGYPQVPKTNF